MKKIILSLIVGAFFLPAMSFGAHWQADRSVSISTLRPVQENAYLAGNVVTVSGDVDGDLFAAGSSISVSGDVSGDIMAAGSIVNLIGSSAEDVRVAGSSLTLSGNFSGELLGAGALIDVTSDARIGENVYLSGSALGFNGQAAGDVTLAGERVEFNGSAGGDLTVKGSKDFFVGPDAVVSGDLNYSGPKEARIDPAAEISGDINFTLDTSYSHGRKDARSLFAKVFTLVSILKFIAFLIFAYLLWYLRRKDSLDIVQQATSKFGTSLLRGCIFLIVVPAGIVALLFSLIGFPIALFAGLIYGAILILAYPFAMIFASSLVMRKRIDLKWYHILFGSLVLALVGLIPLVGWLAVLLVYLATLGALLTSLKARLKK